MIGLRLGLRQLKSCGWIREGRVDEECMLSYLESLLLLLSIV